MDIVKSQLDTMDCVQKNIDSGEISRKSAFGHSGHSSFIEKMIIKKLIGKSSNNTYIKGGCGEVTVSTVSKPKSASQPDPRFRSQKFRTAVRLVLESFGLEPNFGNFKKYDKAHNSSTPIDWLAFAHNLLHPVFGMAKCFILNGLGQRVTYQDKPQYNICSVRANSESEAVELIQSRGYEFGGFLSEVGFDKELRARGGMVHVKSLPENTVALVFG